MKIINKGKNKGVIILDDQDTLEIMSFNGNKEKIIVQCINSSLHIDNLTISTIKEKSLEEKEIMKMKKYLNDKK